eukprot:354069-Chlamydomonas_euryale.AAC.26
MRLWNAGKVYESLNWLSTTSAIDAWTCAAAARSGPALPGVGAAKEGLGERTAAEALPSAHGHVHGFELALDKAPGKRCRRRSTGACPARAPPDGAGGAARRAAAAWRTCVGAPRRVAAEPRVQQRRRVEGTVGVDSFAAVVIHRTRSARPTRQGRRTWRARARGDPYLRHEPLVGTLLIGADDGALVVVEEVLPQRQELLGALAASAHLLQQADELGLRVDALERGVDELDAGQERGIVAGGGRLRGCGRLRSDVRLRSDGRLRGCGRLRSDGMLPVGRLRGGDRLSGGGRLRGCGRLCGGGRLRSNGRLRGGCRLRGGGRLRSGSRLRSLGRGRAALGERPPRMRVSRRHAHAHADAHGGAAPGAGRPTAGGPHSARRRQHGRRVNVLDAALGPRGEKQADWHSRAPSQLQAGRLTLYPHTGPFECAVLYSAREDFGLRS